MVSCWVAEARIWAAWLGSEPDWTTRGEIIQLCDTHKNRCPKLSLPSPETRPLAHEPHGPLYTPIPFSFLILSFCCSLSQSVLAWAHSDLSVSGKSIAENYAPPVKIFCLTSRTFNFSNIPRWHNIQLRHRDFKNPSEPRGCVQAEARKRRSSDGFGSRNRITWIQEMYSERRHEQKWDGKLDKSGMGNLETKTGTKAGWGWQLEQTQE